MAKIVHAAAVVLVDKDGRVLIAQRQPGQIMPDYWEFPGGKLQDGETPEDCIRREASEELGIALGCFAPLNFISETRDGYHVIVYLFICREWDGIPQGIEGQPLKWLRPNALYEVELLPANRPLISAIREVV